MVDNSLGISVDLFLALNDYITSYYEWKSFLKEHDYLTLIILKMSNFRNVQEYLVDTVLVKRICTLENGPKIK